MSKTQSDFHSTAHRLRTTLETKEELAPLLSTISSDLAALTQIYDAAIAQLSAKTAASDSGYGALAESRGRWKQLFELLPAGASVLDSKGRIAEANPALRALLGVEAGVLVSDLRLPGKFVLEDGSEVPAEEFPSVRAIRENTTVVGKVIGVKKNEGAIMWLEVSAAPLPFEDSACVVLAQDITERVELQKQAERLQGKTNQTKRQLELVADAIPGPVARIDRNGCYRFASKRYEEWFGWKSDQVIGRTLSEILPASLYATVKPYVVRALKGEPAKFETTFHTVDGRELASQVNYMPYYDERGDVDGFFIVVYDITELKKSEVLLRFERDRFETLVRGLNQSAIVALSDLSGRFTMVNDHFCEVSGYSKDELIGASFQVLDSGLHPAVFYQEIFETVSQGKTWHGEVQNRAKSGAVYWVDATVTPISGLNDEKQYMSIHFDITKRKEAELKALQSSKMASLGEMAGGIAHEINNPLAIIQGKCAQMAQKLKAGAVDPAFLIENLEKVVETTNRITRIVRGLRIFSRQSEGDSFAPVTIETIVNDTLSLCAERFRINGVNLKVGGSLDAKVECRQVAICQVLLNLLNNAYDAVHGAEAKWVDLEIRADEASNRVVLKVRDSGRGVPKEVEHKIMNPFFTTKAVGKGTGLGLSISTGIVEDHKGRLYLDRTAQNTCFVVELPMRQQQKNR